MILKMSVPLWIICAALAGCGSSSGTSSSTSSSTSKALGACETSTNYHEYQLTADSSLKASFDQIAVAHLETNATSPDDTRDSATAGVDTIPYTVTDGPREITFTLSSSGTVSTAVLTDANGSVVLTLNKGDAATAVTLASGNYTLTLTSDNTATTPIFVMPSSCVTGEASASVSALASVSKSLTKAVTYQTPGVYISELPADPATTIPIAQSDANYFVGVASKGVLNTPTNITSWNQYQQTFGSNTLTLFDLSVYEFFISGGTALYIVNVASATPAALLAGLNTISSTDFNLLVMPDLADMSQSDAITVLSSALPIVADSKAIMVVDYPSSIITQAGIIAFAQQVKNSASTDIDHAAIFFPAITVLNPISSQQVLIGNGSTLAGMMVDNDIAVGVWQAPAGVVYGLLTNAVSLPVDPSETDAVTLKADGINPIRDILGFGITSWGDTTLFLNTGAADGSNMLSVRRTMLAVEQAITAGSQWAVFEPNDAETWSLMISNISNYLTTLWQEGALYGATASQAFTVECGLGTTMTADDILNGFLITQVNLALVRPSEFVTLSFTLQMQTD